MRKRSRRRSGHAGGRGKSDEPPLPCDGRVGREKTIGKARDRLTRFNPRERPSSPAGAAGEALNPERP